MKNLPVRLLLRHALPALMHRFHALWLARRVLGGEFSVALRAKRDALCALPFLLRERGRIRRLIRPAGVRAIERMIETVPVFSWNHWREEIRAGLRWPGG
jgi:hypothetical protein